MKYNFDSTLEDGFHRSTRLRKYLLCYFHEDALNADRDDRRNRRLEERGAAQAAVREAAPVPATLGPLQQESRKARRWLVRTVMLREEYETIL